MSDKGGAVTDNRLYGFVKLFSLLTAEKKDLCGASAYVKSLYSLFYIKLDKLFECFVVYMVVRVKRCKKCGKYPFR